MRASARFISTSGEVSMTKAAKSRLPKMTVLQQTLGNPDFLKTLEDSLATTVDQVYKPGNPTYLPGYAGQNMYFHSIDNSYHELRRRGFKVESYRGQLRLHSEKGYDCPIYLTFSGGTFSDNITTFRWQKGIVTRQSILCNQSSYKPLQPTLFDVPVENGDVFNELYLTAIYDVSSKHLNGWLVMGTEWVNNQKLYCPESAMICKRQHDIDTIPDILPTNDDSNYYIDFGEKLTGT